MSSLRPSTPASSRNGRPQGQLLGGHHDHVRDLVADQRLGPGDQVGDQQLVAELAVRDGPVALVDHLDDRLVLEQVDAAVALAVGAEDAGLGHGVQLEGAGPPGGPDGVAKLVGVGLARAGDGRRADPQPALQLLGREQPEHRPVGVEELRLVPVQGLDHGRRRGGRLQPQDPVHPDVDAGRHPVGHVQGPGGADRGDRHPARQPRLQADVVVPAEEPGQVLAPLGPVGHEHPLAAGAAAGGHGPVAAVQQLVAGQAVQVGLDRGQGEPPVGDQVVEAVHHRRLVDGRQLAELDRPVGPEADAGVALPVEGGAGRRVADHLLQPPALVGGQLGPGPAVVPDELAAQAHRPGDLGQPSGLVGRCHLRTSVPPARRPSLRAGRPPPWWTAAPRAPGPGR